LGRVYLDHGQVSVRVAPDQFRLQDRAIYEGYADVLGALHNMVVGDDVSFLVNDETAASAPAKTSHHRDIDDRWRDLLVHLRQTHLFGARLVGCARWQQRQAGSFAVLRLHTPHAEGGGDEQDDEQHPC